MPLYSYIFRESPVKLWGLNSGQRIERVLKAYGKIIPVNDLSVLKSDDSVLIFDGGYLFDDRLVQYLAKAPNLILQLEMKGEKVAVAAHVTADLAHQVLDVIGKTSGTESLPTVEAQTLDTLPIAFQRSLRKSAPPFVLPISTERARDLEQWLYDWSYKGVTDLVTKWLWPVPAQWMVRQCVRFGIRPNHVTSTGLLLVILAGVLFSHGQFVWGLLAGWIMTFLDTVDGKLARVTVTSSKFGHYFDHIIDLVHPPLWYILWGLGLSISYPESGAWFSLAVWAILIGYVVGRLTEGLFKVGLGEFGLFCWRPVDSYFRLITGRRNPNLILLTAGTLMGRPDFGLLAVVFWTVLSSLFLILRLVMGGFSRLTKGPLQSWFVDAAGGGLDTLAVRIFTKHGPLP
jgi:phosphatidylglycerophosphate synthase